jgi:biopolymer transport protein ExbB
VLPVRLHSGNFDIGAVAPDGADLRVLGADDKTPLPFEIERFDAINELALLWVRVPAVAQGSDKNLLHVYAGNDKATAESKVAVFAADHATVLHFSEAEGLALDAAGGPASSGLPRARPTACSAVFCAMATPLAFAPNRKLALAPGGLTVALWLRPDAPAETSTLVTLGSHDQAHARPGRGAHRRREARRRCYRAHRSHVA